jgi:hypothetical protein
MQLVYQDPNAGGPYLKTTAIDCSLSININACPHLDITEERYSIMWKWHAL